MIQRGTNMSRPKSDFEARRDDLRKVYDGDPWHGSSITDVLKGVEADAAALRNIPRGHTIWEIVLHMTCLLYTSDAADDLLCVDLGGRRIIKKKKKKKKKQ